MLTKNESQNNIVKYPDGSISTATDEIIILSLWAKYMMQKGKEIMFAGMGHPSYPLNQDICASALNYWYSQCLQNNISINLLPKNKKLICNDINKLYLSPARPNTLAQQAKNAEAYKEKALQARTIMAAGLNKWYGLDNKDANMVKIKPENIIFTLGGSAMLHMLFNVMNKLRPSGNIITPFPHYTLYFGPGNLNKLIAIDTLSNKGFHLPAGAIRAAVLKAHSENKPINAILICNPNNPLGNMMRPEDWQEILDVLDEEQCLLIIDEAYAELSYRSNRPSLLEFLAQKIDSHDGSSSVRQTALNHYKNLLKKIIIIRSATKGFSASGERMAIGIIFNKNLHTILNMENEKMGPLPVFLQKAYAMAMYNLDPTVVNSELKLLQSYYLTQVRYVEEKLKKLNIMHPNAIEGVEGGFYVLVNLSKLINTKISEIIILNQMKQIGLELKDGMLTSDKDIAYYILFKAGVMITPLSFFGANPTQGYLRITCAMGKKKLDNLLDILHKLIHGQDSLAMPLQPKDEIIAFANSSEDLSMQNISWKSYTDEIRQFDPEREFSYAMLNYWKKYAFKISQMKKLISTYCVQEEKEYIVEHSYKLKMVKPFLKNIYYKTSWQELLNVTGSSSDWLKENFIKIISFLIDEKKINGPFFAAIPKVLKMSADKFQYLSAEFDFQLNSKNYSKLINYITLQWKEITLLKIKDIYLQHEISAGWEQQPYSFYSLFKGGYQVIMPLKVMPQSFHELQVEWMKNANALELLQQEASTIEKKEISIIEYLYAVVWNYEKECYLKEIFCKKISTLDNFAIIEKMIDLNSAIDYGHPQGDLENRMLLKQSIAKCYSEFIIEPENILLIGCNPLQLFKTAFPELIVDYFSLEKKLTIFKSKYIYFSLKELRNKCAAIQQEEVIKNLATVLLDSSLNVIIDETGTEAHLLHFSTGQQPRARISIIRSGVEFCTVEHCQIAMIIVFNKEIRSRLNDVVTNMNVHAPRSLQFAYAKCFSLFADVISRKNIKESNVIPKCHFQSDMANVNYITQSYKNYVTHASTAMPVVDRLSFRSKY